MSNKMTLAAALVVALSILAGCAAAPIHYVNPDVDFGFVRRVAVVPFQNLSADRYASQRTESVFQAELLSYEGIEVLDPGEVLGVWNELRFGADVVLTPQQIVTLGERLGVDALFTGSVEEYGLERLGNNQAYTVTAVFGLAETTTGAVIWSSQVHADGSSLWKKLFGGQPKSLYAVSRSAVRDALDTLLAGGGGDDGDRRGRSSRDSSRGN
jgi:hypothetical protein